MSALGPCRCGHPGAGCTCYDERLAEAVRQHHEAAGEPLDGPGPGTETPEAPGGSHGGAEPVEPEPSVFVFTRADAALVMALLVSGRGRQRRSTWSEAEQAAEQRLNDYWLGRIDAECTHPEPGPVDTAEPPVVRRPHWLPRGVWMGVIVGQWPLTSFTNRDAAERWAVLVGGERRIWPVDIPDSTPVFKAEAVPASTRLVEAQW